MRLKFWKKPERNVRWTVLVEIESDENTYIEMVRLLTETDSHQSALDRLDCVMERIIEPGEFWRLIDLRLGGWV